MRLRISALLFVALTLALACGESGPPTDEATWAIVNGERTNMNEDAVVAVLNRAGGLCTGTLIASRVVLTAKHCVQNPDAASPTAPSSMVIGVGDSINGLSRTFGAIDIWTTDGVYREYGLQGLVGQDIAVITLRSDVTGVTPIPVYREDPNGLFGTELKAVGFGETPSGGAGIKYRVGTSVSRYRGGVIYTPPTICQGDSGGPLITATGQVVGIASFGSACGAGENGYNHIYSFLPEVDEVLRAAGACTDDGSEICDGGDNDCDGLVDETCLDVGAPCATGDECLTARCEDTPGGRICTQDCDPVRPSTGCGAGLHCGRIDGGCEGRCEPGEAGSLPNGAACAADTDCASLLCLDPGDGEMRCLDPCRGDAGMCLHGEACVALPGSCGGCVEDAIYGGARLLGERCEGDADCSSGDCLVDVGDGYCTRGCTDDASCGDGFHCRLMGDSSANICVRGDRSGAGENCVDNFDCAEGLFCAERGSEAWCTNFCTTAEDCPTEFSCVAVGEVSICAPDAGIVGSECASDADCISGYCQPVGADGESVCSRLCSAESTCAPGFACVRASDGVSSVCISAAAAARDDDGCSVGGRPSGGFAFLALLTFFLAMRRREVV